jgi:hypothetical protein
MHKNAVVHPGQAMLLRPTAPTQLSARQRRSSKLILADCSTAGPSAADIKGVVVDDIGNRILRHYHESVQKLVDKMMRSGWMSTPIPCDAAFGILSLKVLPPPPQVQAVAPPPPPAPQQTVAPPTQAVAAVPGTKCQIRQWATREWGEILLVVLMLSSLAAILCFLTICLYQYLQYG